MTKPSDLSFAFEGVLIAATKDRHGYVVKIVIHPNDVPSAFVHDPVGSRYQFGAVLVNDTGEATRSGGEKKTHVEVVQRAAMLCRNPDFQHYMSINYRTPYTEAGAREAILKACDISSRAELSSRESARKLFENIVSSYRRYIIETED